MIIVIVIVVIWPPLFTTNNLGRQGFMNTVLLRWLSLRAVLGYAQERSVWWAGTGGKGAGLDAQQGAVTHSVPDTVLCSTQLWNDTVGETLSSAVASFRIGSPS